MMIVYSHGILSVCLWPICNHEPWIKFWIPLMNSASAHNALRSMNSSAQVKLLGSMQTPPVPSLITSSNSSQKLSHGPSFLSAFLFKYAPSSSQTPFKQSIVSQNHHHWILQSLRTILYLYLNRHVLLLPHSRSQLYVISASAAANLSLSTLLSLNGYK
jgi:hypothetical protein